MVNYYCAICNKIVPIGKKAVNPRTKRTAVFQCLGQTLIWCTRHVLVRSEQLHCETRASVHADGTAEYLSGRRSEAELLLSGQQPGQPCTKQHAVQPPAHEAAPVLAACMTGLQAANEHAGAEPCQQATQEVHEPWGGHARNVEGKQAAAAVLRAVVIALADLIIHHEGVAEGVAKKYHGVTYDLKRKHGSHRARLFLEGQPCTAVYFLRLSLQR